MSGKGLNELTIPELKYELSQRGLETGGSKADLSLRLEEHIRKEEGVNPLTMWFHFAERTANPTNPDQTIARTISQNADREAQQELDSDNQGSRRGEVNSAFTDKLTSVYDVINELFARMETMDKLIHGQNVVITGQNAVIAGLRTDVTDLQRRLDERNNWSRGTSQLPDGETQLPWSNGTTGRNSRRTETSGGEDRSNRPFGESSRVTESSGERDRRIESSGERDRRIEFFGENPRSEPSGENVRRTELFGENPRRTESFGENPRESELSGENVRRTGFFGESSRVTESFGGNPRNESSTNVRRTESSGEYSRRSESSGQNALARTFPGENSLFSGENECSLGPYGRTMNVSGQMSRNSETRRVHFQESSLISQDNLNAARASLPEYAGKRYEDPLKFLNEAEDILEEIGIQERRWVKVLTNQLKAEAGTWWGTIRSMDPTWPEFRRCFLRKFNNEETLKRLRNELLSEEQGNIQPSEEFVLSKIQLSRRVEIGLTEGQLIKNIVGLMRRELQMLVNMHDPLTLEDLRDVAAKLDVHGPAFNA